jgi:hypothetical protein
MIRNPRATPNSILAAAVIDNVNPDSIQRINHAIDRGARLDFSHTNWDSTPLHDASKVRNNVSNINALLNRGANVDITDDYDNTPLIVAARVPNNSENIRQLLSRGADINLMSQGRQIDQLSHPTNRDTVIKEMNFQERKPYLQLTEGTVGSDDHISKYLLNDLIQKEVSSYRGKQGGKSRKSKKSKKSMKSKKSKKSRKSKKNY